MESKVEQHLHIISFDIPFPADYGGVIDVFYKLKALAKLQIKVHLHCYQYGRAKDKHLEESCFQVHYYKRTSGLNNFLSQLPYIVATRNSSELLKTLQQDDYPILFEGLHSCSFIDHPSLKSRVKLVRMHNIEHEYYYQLSLAEKNILKKIYYRAEVPKLKRFESKLKHSQAIFAISKKDDVELKTRFKNVYHIPAFHSNEEIESKTGRGDFIIYHGNLSVAENEKAVLFLLTDVFNRLDVKCIIAGKNPSQKIIKIAENMPHLELVINPSESAMNKLIQDAHIQILPTFQDTGIKLKLLKSVALGRFCLVNSTMVKQTGLEDVCLIADTATEFVDFVQNLMQQSFSQENLDLRSSIWNSSFSNVQNARKIRNILKEA